MASLKRRGKGGVYYAQWYEDGKQRRKSLETTCRQLAKERLKELEEGSEPSITPTGPSKTLLSEIVAAYIKDIRGKLNESTQKAHLWVLGDLFGPVCDDLKTPDGRSRGRMKRKFTLLPPLQVEFLEDIKKSSVADFIAARVSQRGIAPKTANRYREILVRLINWAMAERDVVMPGGINPIERLKRYAEPQHTIRYLKPKQIIEQLDLLADKPLLQAMVAALIFAGLRREELLWLTHDDIDLSHGPNGVIHVRAKEIGGKTWIPKTKTNRVIPISSDLRRYLDTYTPRVVRGHWYFPSPNGHRWNPDNFSADLRNINKEVGLEWNCLDYRHTFGSILAQKGVSLYKIATLMGNSPEICRRHYAALCTESLVDAVEFDFLNPEDPSSDIVWQDKISA